MRDFYAAFNTWREKFQSSIVDLGGKLKPGGKVVTSSGVIDGPFTEAKELIGGFMIVAADNLEDAAEIPELAETPLRIAPGLE